MSTRRPDVDRPVWTSRVKSAIEFPRKRTFNVHDNINLYKLYSYVAYTAVRNNRLKSDSQLLKGLDKKRRRITTDVIYAYATRLVSSLTRRT